MKKIIFLTMGLLLSALSLNGQECTGFKTFTIGGWGTECNGGNPGCYRDANFASAFPSGLMIGCGTNTLSLTSSLAVQQFLPAGGTPSVLPSGNMTDPGNTYVNTLAAQLVGVKLAVGFDAYDAGFSSSPEALGNLIIMSGPFVGMTVNAFLSLADETIGGCASDASIEDLNAAATAINENFDNGTTNNGYLVCNPFRLSIGLSTSANCFGYSDGTQTVSVTGGTAPFTYELSNGMQIVTSDTSVTFTGLSAGNYSITVTDANNLSATGTNAFTIGEPLEIGITLTPGNVSCFGGTNGSVSVSVSGGVPPYTYLWNTGSTDDHIDNLPAGTYSVVVTDSTSCHNEAQVTLTEPSILGFTADITEVSCNAGSNGEVAVTPTGGTAPYAILWTGGSTDFTRTGLSAGTYTAVITDFNGCTANVSVTITQPDALAVSFVTANVTCFGGFGSATANVTGGKAPYSYSWNSDPVQTTQTATLPVGTWTVVVTDDNGCTASANVTLILLSCQGFKTITQGGYGAACKGQNWGCYLNNNFAAAFPSGLTIGSGTRFLKLTSATAVRNFLPSGSTPRALNPGTVINPTKTTYSNVLAGQTVALTLTLAFDANPNFSPSNTPLGSLIVNSGPFAGMTVSQLLQIANTILGGGASAFTAAQINDAIDAVNRNYDNGTIDLGFLSCPCSVGAREITEAINAIEIIRPDLTVYPNPSSTNATVAFTFPHDTEVNIQVFDINGRSVKQLFSGNVKAEITQNLDLQTDTLPSGMYLLRMTSGHDVITKALMVNR